MAETILDIRDLRIAFATSSGMLEAVSGVDVSLKRGGVLGIVGESGSGKSVALKSVMGLLPPSAQVSGSAMFDGQDLLALPERAMRKLRGSRIAMVFQDPLTAFNPVTTIGSQIAEVIELHDRSLTRSQLRERAVSLLDLVSIPEAKSRFDSYPHEFSGGMRQRVMIAMALANDPDLLIADEPTTALDVTVQAQILDVLRELQQRLGISLVLITHDLGVVAGMADEVAVMYSGRIVERADVEDLFADPRHPYTRGLIASVPVLAGERRRIEAIEGSPPSLLHRPAGCSFAPRCRVSSPLCHEERPQLLPSNSSISACHFRDDLSSEHPLQVAS